DGGMRLDADAERWLHDRTGMAPMRSESGLAVLRGVLLGNDRQVLVLEGDGRRLRRLFDAPVTPVDRTPSAPERLAAAAGSTSATASATGAAIDGGGDLLVLCRDFLRREFAPVLKIAPGQIDPGEALENYGINSILAMNLTSLLEKRFGPLPKTLFFEHQTVAALSAHLVDTQADRLRALLTT